MEGDGPDLGTLVASLKPRMSLERSSGRPVSGWQKTSSLSYE